MTMKFSLFICLLVITCTFPFGLVFVPLVWMNIVSYIRVQESNLNIIDEKNGLFFHELKYRKEYYFIAIDKKNEKISIQTGSNKKSLNFTDVTGWGYVIADRVKHFGSGGAKAVGYAHAGNIKSGKKAWVENHFFIKTNDINTPIIRLKFFNRGSSVPFHNDNFWHDVEEQFIQWKLIFDKTVNN